MHHHESLRAAALRELAEETGLQLSTTELIGPIWRRTAQFVFAGVDHHQNEFYFAACAPAGFQVDTGGFTAVEQQSITGHRWFSADDLSTATDRVYPVKLGSLIPQALRYAAGAPLPVAVPEID